jgi:hypothetical protein
LTGSNIGGVLQEISRWRDVLIAHCNSLAALSIVGGAAGSSSTQESLGGLFLHVSMGTRVLGALSPRLTACGVIATLGFVVWAALCCRIVLVDHIQGALVMLAESLEFTATVAVLSFTCGIYALDDLSVVLVSIRVVANVGVAECPEIAASVTVGICAHEASALKHVSIPLVHIALRARV